VSDPLLQLQEDRDTRTILQVDRESTDPSVFSSIGDALLAAKPNNIIRIASGNYIESLVINIPNLIIEPHDEESKVVIISTK